VERRGGGRKIHRVTEPWSRRTLNHEGARELGKTDKGKRSHKTTKKGAVVETFRSGAGTKEKKGYRGGGKDPYVQVTVPKKHKVGQDIIRHRT